MPRGHRCLKEDREEGGKKREGGRKGAGGGEGEGGREGGRWEREGG